MASPDMAQDASGAQGVRRLLEREGELAALDAVIDVAQAADGAAAVLAGEAGIGKTSLLLAAAERAQARGLRVLRARGDELERGFPWGVVIQLFGALAREPDAGSTFAGPAALAEPLFVRATTAADPFPLLHGLHWLTANLAEREPLLLVVDDVHLSDAESLQFLNYLLHRIDGLAVSLVVAVRAGEPAADPVAALLDHLRADARTRVLPVAPLHSASIEAIIARELPDAESSFREALAAAVAGNPFLCRELLAAVRAEGVRPTAKATAAIREVRAEGIRSSILVRLGRLGEDAGALAAATAVLGTAPVRLAGALAELEEADAIAAADVLETAGIFEPRADCAFVHPIAREVVYADLTSGRRRRAHLAAARLMRDHGADAEAISGHLLAGDPAGEEWAVATLREAAATDLRRFAPTRAVELLRAAVNDPAGEDLRADLLFELGRAEAAAGDPGAVDRLREALRLAGAGRDAIAVSVALVETLYAAGHYDEAAAASERALEVLDALPAAERDPVAEARLLAGLTPGRLIAQYPERARERVEALVTAPSSSPSPADRVLMASTASEHAISAGLPRDRVVELAGAALSGDDVPEELGPVMVELAVVALVFSDEYERALEVLDAVIDRARARGEAAESVNLMTLRALSIRPRGPLALAVAEAEDAIRIDADVPGPTRPVLAPARYALARASLDRGEPDRAAEAVGVADAQERWGSSPLYGWYLDGLGRVELARGRPTEALAAFLGARDAFGVHRGVAAVFCDWRSGAALAAQAAGDIEQAKALAAEELELARSYGSGRGAGAALRAQGLLADDAAESVDLLRDAAAAVAETEAAVEHARTIIDLGAALRRGGWDRDSREPLRVGAELARRGGALALVERAAEELEASGARRPRLALSGVESLTPSQRRVAEMAASGMSNPEIAAALFVAQRTVETHLTAAYGKLEIGSRDELPAALA